MVGVTSKAYLRRPSVAIFGSVRKGRRLVGDPGAEARDHLSEREMAKRKAGAQKQMDDKFKNWRMLAEGSDDNRG